MRKFTSFLIVIIAVTILFGCNESRNDAEYPTIAVISLNQNLLREAVSDLAAVSGFKVEISESLGKVNDLAIDYKAKEKPLNEVANGIVAYVKSQYGLDIKWSIAKPRTLRFSLITEP